MTLPDEPYRRAERLARLTGREVADVLAETIDVSLQPLGVQQAPDPSVTDLSNADVLALTESQMDSGQDRRLAELLEKQQAGYLADDE